MLARTDDLISRDYARLNAKLHQAQQFYGTSGGKWAPMVRALARYAGTRTLLDYGCGKQTLAQAMGPHFSVTPYDPGIPGLEALPSPHDVVVCGDVLEHIEPDRIDAVLAHLAQLTDTVLFIVLSTRPAVKTLEDGRNAHQIIEPPQWWLDKLTAAGMRTLQYRHDADFGELVLYAIPRSPKWRYMRLWIRFVPAGLPLRLAFTRRVNAIFEKRRAKKTDAVAPLSNCVARRLKMHAMQFNRTTFERCTLILNAGDEPPKLRECTFVDCSFEGAGWPRTIEGMSVSFPSANEWEKPNWA